MMETKGKESPIPYPCINTCMQRTFETLCPRKVKLADYDKTPIPLEVLKQISFSVKENHFQKIEIWYDEKSPDALAIGIRGYYYLYDNTYESMKDENNNTVKFLTEQAAEKAKRDDFKKVCFNMQAIYLIARWGDVKQNFEELKKMAIDKFIDVHKAKIKTEISVLQERLTAISENSKLYIQGEITLSRATTSSNY